MRQKLNENPLFQALAIGVLALLVGVMLLMRMGGGGGEATGELPQAGETVPATPATDTGAVDPAAGDAAAADPPVTAPVAGATAAPSGGAGTEFEAGPGLPAEIVNAYDGGQAVALLIVNDRGIDDRDLQRTVEATGSRADVAVFTTDVKEVADYSRITEGVDLDRTPALVVIRPKRLNEGSIPDASIAYGFRGTGSVQQAFDDALYDGPNDLPYHP